MASKQLYFEDVEVGAEIPPLVKKPTNVSIFQYVASMYFTHRIHFDYKFATEHDGLPDILLPGTVPCDYYAQMLIDWVGEGGVIKKVSYQNRGYTIPGDTVTCSGKVTKKYVKDGDHYIECELSMVNQRGENTAPGAGAVILPSRAA